MKKLLAILMVSTIALTAVFCTGCSKSTEDLIENAKVYLPDDK